MAPPRVRLLPDLCADGPTQMAADEVLLEAAQRGVASLRFYTWETATLSLGYFQRAADREADPLLAALPLVRRPTGGGAIVHDRELTYSFALPPGERWQPRGESWLCRFHHRLVEAFAALGVSSRPCPCGEERGREEFLCFLHHAPGDVMIGPHKVAGSRQRRRRGALLQHGSILLARSPHALRLPGVGELAGTSPPPGQVKAALLDALRAGDGGWEIVPGDWEAGEAEAISERVTSKYAHPSWTARR